MNIDEVATLLHIAEKTMQWPKLKPIHEEAMQALEAHAEERRQVAAKQEAEDKPPLDDEPKTPPEEVKRRET